MLVLFDYITKIAFFSLASGNLALVGLPRIQQTPGATTTPREWYPSEYY